MSRYIARLATDAYVDWSTVVDAPVSWVKDKQAAVSAWGYERIARADRNGTSILGGHPGKTPAEIVAGNRAGPDEAPLTVAEIIAAYNEDDHAPWTQS